MKSSLKHDNINSRQAPDSQALLLIELQHRVRNILAMIRSMVGRMDTSRYDVEEFVHHLQARIDALARTQNVISRAPGQPIDLENIIREELLAQAAREDSFTLKGPAVDLPVRAAEVMTLVLHELAMNAMKYGALGSETGKLRISWSKQVEDEEEWLVLRWRENGGVDAKTDPVHGFGAEQIIGRVPYELDGRSDWTLTSDGALAKIAFPLRAGTALY
jgi:two-component sensor histidine kinase